MDKVDHSGSVLLTELLQRLSTSQLCCGSATPHSLHNTSVTMSHPKEHLPRGYAAGQLHVVAPCWRTGPWGTRESLEDKKRRQSVRHQGPGSPLGVLWGSSGGPLRNERAHQPQMSSKRGSCFSGWTRAARKMSLDRVTSVTYRRVQLHNICKSDSIVSLTK